MNRAIISLSYWRRLDRTFPSGNLYFQLLAFPAGGGYPRVGALGMAVYKEECEDSSRGKQTEMGKEEEKGRWELEKDKLNRVGGILAPFKTVKVSHDQPRFLAVGQERRTLRDVSEGSL